MGYKTKSWRFKYLIVFFLTALSFGYFFIVSIHSTMPTNVISPLPLEESLNVKRSFPQGWGFYSKNPKEPAFSVINIEKGEVGPKWPNNRSVNLFGLKRYGRSQGIEAGAINQNILESPWRKCEKEMIICMKESEVVQEIENPLSSPTLCGDIGFGYQEQVPWSWSKSKILMPSKIARVRVLCSNR